MALLVTLAQWADLGRLDPVAQIVPRLDPFARNELDIGGVLIAILGPYDATAKLAVRSSLGPVCLHVFRTPRIAGPAGRGVRF